MATRARTTKRVDPGAMLAGFVAQLEQKTGFKLDTVAVIPAGQSFLQWCIQLGHQGMMVDGKPFKLDDRPAMAWIYDQIPTTDDEAYRYILVIMKCAQVGFTVMEILAAIYLGIKFGPATVGMFLPDMNLAGIKSTERFMPIVRSIPAVHKLMTQDAADGSGTKSGEGNVTKRRLDKALYVFSWTSGRATTESIPMDVLNFDEVQEMTKEQIEKTYERLSASPIRFMLMGSTANWPEADIHHWYLKGTQHEFHTECPTCGSAKPLDHYFPKCIQFDKELNRYRYVCENGHWIEDTQQGKWIPGVTARSEATPDVDTGIEFGVEKKYRKLRIKSIHFPQFLSPTISPDEILTSYNGATDMKNFYNRKLGKPYLDPSQIPVTLAHLAACVAAGKLANPPAVWKTRARDTYMGIDQMGNFNVHVIKERLPSGRQALIHLEETYDEDPFARSGELMQQFGVAVCVVEINPNYNDAKKFANKFPGRVFICNSFGSVEEGMILWGDAPKLDTSDRRTDEESRDRYTLRMDQYKCMQVSMARFVNAECLIPDPQGLVQDVIDKGIRHQAAVAPRAFHHFTKTALVSEKDDETNKYKRSVKKVGIDPHFSYANMLCDVAWARAHGTASFIIPDPSGTGMPSIRPEDIGAEPVINIVNELRAQSLSGDVCGRCSGYDAERGLCMERWFKVKPEDIGCELFVEDEYAEDGS